MQQNVRRMDMVDHVGNDRGYKQNDLRRIV
jgi:hypothetical protein